jgi:hypothetical protein
MAGGFHREEGAIGAFTRQPEGLLGQPFYGWLEISKLGSCGSAALQCGKPLAYRLSSFY